MWQFFPRLRLSNIVFFCLLKSFSELKIWQKCFAVFANFKNLGFVLIAKSAKILLPSWGATIGRQLYSYPLFKHRLVKETVAPDKQPQPQDCAQAQEGPSRPSTSCKVIADNTISNTNMDLGESLSQAPRSRIGSARSDNGTVQGTSINWLF